MPAKIGPDYLTSCLNVALDVKQRIFPGLMYRSALSLHNLISRTVNSEIFVRVLFLRK